MPEHYTKSTVQVSVWCNHCNKDTPHRVDDGRRGPCLVCMARPTVPKTKKTKPEETQMEMFN